MQEDREDKVDIKATIKKFVEPEEPELEQKEAIMKYQEYKDKKKKNSSSDGSMEGNSEEQEHLNRVKKELLASLKRVEDMEKKVFNNDLIDEKNRLKVRKANSSGKSVTLEKEEQVLHKEETQKERE